MIVALKCERVPIAELLLKQLPEQMDCAAMVRPRQNIMQLPAQPGRPAREVQLCSTFNVGELADGHPGISLLDVVASLSSHSASMLIVMWQHCPPTTPWEGLHWLKCMHDYTKPPRVVTSWDTIPGCHTTIPGAPPRRAELQHMFRSIVERFGTRGGLGRDPSTAEGAGGALADVRDIGGKVTLPPELTTPGGLVCCPDGRLLSPWVIRYRKSPFFAAFCKNTRSFVKIGSGQLRKSLGDKFRFLAAGPGCVILSLAAGCVRMRSSWGAVQRTMWLGPSAPEVICVSCQGTSIHVQGKDGVMSH